MTIVISDEMDVRARKITKDKEQHYIMKKESNHQEDIKSQMCMQLKQNFKIRKAKNDRTGRRIG